MAITVEKMPPADGAAFRCSVNVRISEWPYSRRCALKPVGMITEDDYAKATRMFSLGGRVVCQYHIDNIEAYLEEVK